MTLTDPYRLEAGDLLAALGELDCARVAQVYAALGFPVVPMHRPAGRSLHLPGPEGVSGPGQAPAAAGRQRLAAVDPAVAGEWWRRWPDANLALVTGRRFDVLDLDGEQGVEALRAALSIAPAEHPGPVARTGGAAGTCCTSPRAWATGSGCCRGWTGGAAAG